MKAVTGGVTWNWFIHHNVKSYMHAPLLLGLKGPLPITGGLACSNMKLKLQLQATNQLEYFTPACCLDSSAYQQPLFSFSHNNLKDEKKDTELNIKVVRLMAHIHKLKFFFFFATSFFDYLIVNKTLSIEKESKHYMSLLFQY